MRIRTVKPSFWKSETLAAIDKEHRLLAVALLNYADDEGYFQAHEALVRGECFPFDDDSASCQRGLAELSRIGFIRVGMSQYGQRVGQIVNFLEHQKIDKPSKSKYADITITWDEGDHNSANTPLELCDPSGTEGNGKGREKEGAPRVVVPEWVPTEEWSAFVEMRRKGRSPFTDHAKKLALGELTKLRDQGHDPKTVINAAILNGWKSFYPPKAGQQVDAPWKGAH